MLILLASPLTPSGPLSECPGANLNRFSLQTTRAVPEERLPLTHVVWPVCTEHVYTWCPPEWASVVTNVSFHTMLLQPPRMSAPTLPSLSHAPRQSALQPSP